MDKVIEQLLDYTVKCDVPGSQGKHYRDNNNCTDGCLALAEHATNRKKDYREETPKKVGLQRSNYTLAWVQHLEFIQLLSPLSESNTVCGLTLFLHLYYLMFVTYDDVFDW